MKYSKSTAQKLAAQIRQRFGLKIARAVKGTPVPQKYVAGLISVEAGKKNGQIVEDATRFEAHVFAKLKAVRDGSLLQYNKIRTTQLKDTSDGALRNLATSFGLVQVMGWWTFHLGCTVAQLRDPETHLTYAVKLMLLNSNGDFERGEYEGEMRQWNSGSEKGKTHDPDYVFNISAVMDAYEELGDVDVDEAPTEVSDVENVATTGTANNETRISVSPPEQKDSPQINVEHAEEVTTAPQPIEGGRKDDEPRQASQGGKKSLIATIVGVVAGAGTAFQGWMQNSNALKVVGLVCITVVLLALIFRQLIMDYVRMMYMSDPTRINVK